MLGVDIYPVDRPVTSRRRGSEPQPSAEIARDHAFALAGTMANTRNGLPLPSRILRGAQTMNAPVGGKQIEVGQALQPISAGAVHVVMTRVRRLEVVALTGISTDRSEPKPTTSLSSTRNLHCVGRRPRGVLTGLIVVLIGDGIGTLDQSVRMSTHARGGMRPCSASHCRRRSAVSRKSGIGTLASREQSITHAGADQILHR